MEYSEKAEANCTTQLKTPAQIKSAGGPDFTDDMPDYNFLGWSRDPFATYPEFCGAGLPNNANFDRNVKLNGVWELKWCWVTFNLMGGSGTSYSIQLPKGGKISNFPETTKNGYIFLGWSTSPEGGVSVTSETIVTNDLILFAQWQMDYSILIQDILDSIPEPSVDPDTPGGGGGEGGSSVTLPITAPLWMSDTGFSKWTDTDGTTERSTTFANGAATPEQPSWYEDIPYGRSGRDEHSYVDTHWYANVGSLDARLRHTASDGSRVECNLYESFTEQGTFSSKGGGQATHYRLLHFSYGGKTYLKVYRQIDILPGRDMLNMSSWGDYEFPDETVYPPRYQFIGHTLVRWYVVATGKHLDGKNSRVPQSREQQLRGIKDAASAWNYLKTLPSPITAINSLSMGDQILGATSFVNRGTGKIRVWMNCTDYASKLNGGDYGFAFWGDRYPIP